MKIEIKNNYNILKTIPKEFVSTVIINDDNFEEASFENEEDLEEFVKDEAYYLVEDENYASLEEGEEIDENSGEITILNLNEIVQTFKHFIRERVCCEKYLGRGYNFCPECGKKLENETD